MDGLEAEEEAAEEEGAEEEPAAVEEAASVEAAEDGAVEPEADSAAKVGLQLSFPAATVAWEREERERKRG